MLTKYQKAWVQSHQGPRVSQPHASAPYGEIFVAIPEGFLCHDCTYVHRIDITSDDVEVWQVDSAGWTGPCVCSDCGLSIPVVVNGK